MEGIEIKNLWVFMFFALLIVRLRGEEGSNDIVQVRKNVTSFDKVDSANGNEDNKNYTNVVVSDKRKNNGGGGSGGGGGGGGGGRGGGFLWGWGGGGGGGGGGGAGGRGGGGGGGGGGWGWGGGGGGYWRWGCGKQVPRGRNHNLGKRGGLKNNVYLIGEFAQCMVRGRCRGMRLDCPLHCGGPCFYDCRYMCKAHCKR